MKWDEMLLHLFQSYFYRHLHIRISHQSDGSWIHTRALYIPAWCLELVGFHSYYISVSSRLLYYSSVESLIHFWPLERNINTINLRFSSQHSKWPLILGQKRTVICMCVYFRILQVHHNGNRSWQSGRTSNLSCFACSQDCRYHSR